ncbi:segregation and condensation protein A [Granulicoccus phenolivorans]|uniref:segregation and condensation protein A n=1 Tax=Granulicoccus phenolivorans TaxID=266854 RepID=UPI0004061076|nr:segregation/condensation protein A [Granulicoccus phenolivorans]
MSAGEQEFHLRLDNFEGPFDLLLQLIAKHKLDITEVALSRVTDEFIAHVKALGPVWDLEQTSHFVLVAATLLDLKAARLLPSGEVEDAEDLALLEARDLLFARLLQYRAFKQIAALMGESLTDQDRWYARPGGLEPAYATLLPEVTIDLTPHQFALLAATVLTPKPDPQVSLAHLHAPRVSVREQADIIVARLRSHPVLTFRALTGDAPDQLTVVCRFLALLELFRQRAVSFEQAAPLGELTIRWTGRAETELAEIDEFDAPVPGADDDEREDDHDDDAQTRGEGDG